jgi:hypothetical protein
MFGQTFKLEDFDNLAIEALSTNSPEIENNPECKCYDFLPIISLWYKTVNTLQYANPQMIQQKIQLRF